MKVKIIGIDEKQFEHLEKFFTKEFGLSKMFDECGFGSWCGGVLTMSNEEEDLLMQQELQKLQSQRNKLNRQIASLKKANLKN